MVQVTAEIPKAYDFLFRPKRYKVVKGGRGSAKSWSIARVLVIRAASEPLRIGCFREIQNSIEESVHKLIKDQIRTLGFVHLFEVTKTGIVRRDKSGQIIAEFIFRGLLRNVDSVKSFEGIDIAWVEEAHNVSEESWELLTPTIRKPGSEIWVSYNPKFEDDPTNQRFAVNPPEDAIVKHINYDQNPWFPAVLRAEMESDKARDLATYEHKWLGLAKGGGRRVWPTFARDVHVKSIPMEEIAKNGNCYMAMDPHSKYYPFIMWIAVLPKNKRKRWPEDFHKHVYAEWPTEGEMHGPYHEYRKKTMYTGSLADIARACYACDGAEHGITIKSRLVDPRYAKGAGDWNWSTSTEGLVEQFAKRENGGLLLTLPEIKRLDAQREAIHADMQWNTMQSIGQFNEPSFSVDPKCKNLITSLLNHRLEDDSDKEDEKYKDPSDALRIGYAGIFGWEDPRPEPEEDYETISSGWSA